MEYLSFKQCMEYLMGFDLLITTFVSDRHITIAKHMKQVLKNIIHYFDLWHIKKRVIRLTTSLNSSLKLFESYLMADVLQALV